ncbi:MAG: HAMP domain-containing histidine kinase [Chloroflexi bacterium]|nr:HAMP domain-containing histidine kinase [Chloroflexota bacterium]
MTRPDFGRIRWRLLAANLAVAGAAVVAVTAGVWLAAPSAFENAMGMRGMGGGMSGMMDPLLRAAFGDAVGTAVVLGLSAAVIVGVAAAVLLSAHLSRPINDLVSASRRVAGGDYGEPVPPATGELGELAASFNEMAARLETIEQHRLDLMGDVAHELRTPIASVRGYVEGLEAGVFEPGPDAWRVLDEQTVRLARLVDDLATLWRAESNDLHLELQTLDAPTLVTEALERNRPLAAARSVSLDVGPVAPGTVRVDRTRLGQALDNLVGNAIRYTPAGGRVELSLTVEGTSVAVAVRDDGPGLTPEQAARVFERFYRGEPSRSREAGGSGLGLTITKSLVEAMGGTVAVVSGGHGHGATFTVSLPRV